MRFLADRFLKKRSLPLTESGVEIKRIYQPYWKIDAVLLKVRNRIQERYVYTDEYSEKEEIKYEQKISDINLAPYTVTVSAAADKAEIPFTIGLRAEYMRMEPFARDNIPDGFECLPVIRPYNQALADVEKGTAGLSNINQAAFGKNITRLFHPRGAVVYFPYFILESDSPQGLRQIVIDGVSGSITSFNQKYEAIEETPDEVPSILDFGRLTVEFHRCPNCGCDLSGKQSYVYICENCHYLIMLESHPMLGNEINAVVGGGHQNDRLFPFWSMKMPDRDTRIIKNLFGGIFDSNRLILPAFKAANFEAIFRLCRRMSSASPKMDYAPVDGFDSCFEPVTLSLEEALTMAEIIIYRATTGRADMASVPEAEFHPEAIEILYAPFHAQSYFYVDSVLGAVTFEKNLMT